MLATLTHGLSSVESAQVTSYGHMCQAPSPGWASSYNSGPWPVLCRALLGASLAHAVDAQKKAQLGGAGQQVSPAPHTISHAISPHLIATTPIVTYINKQHPTFSALWPFYKTE